MPVRLASVGRRFNMALICGIYARSENIEYHPIMISGENTRELLGYVTYIIYISTWWYRCVYMYLGDEFIPNAFELLRLPEIVCDVPLSVLQGEGSAGGVLLQLFDQDSATLHPGNGDCNSLHSALVVRKRQPHLRAWEQHQVQIAPACSSIYMHPNPSIRTHPSIHFLSTKAYYKIHQSVSKFEFHLAEVG